jgi:hypothetical protein
LYLYLYLCGMHKRHISNVIPRALRVARIMERWNATAAFSLLKNSESGRRPLQNLQLSGIFPGKTRCGFLHGI